jgi:SAM-dependent methyltransferase
MFEFGKNWKSYISESNLSEILEQSKNSLRSFLPPDAIKGKSFLDFGCGSGIHSLAALRLGASRVVSVDIDIDSVECSRSLKHNANDAKRWEIREGSLLDQSLIADLGTFDIVYCWGVAHHTGDMYRALDNLYKLVKPGGLLFVALYNKVEGFWGSEKWCKIKKFYNESGPFEKKIMESGYISYHLFRLLIRGNNPFTYFKNFRKKRGMSWKHDLIDWLGGYPYDYASTQEIFTLFREKYGMEMVNIKTTNYIGCNQFLFKK